MFTKNIQIGTNFKDLSYVYKLALFICKSAFLFFI